MKDMKNMNLKGFQEKVKFQLVGQYVFSESFLLGQGAFGKVYLCRRHKFPDDLYAVKVLPKAACEDLLCQSPHSLQASHLLARPIFIIIQNLSYIMLQYWYTFRFQCSTTTAIRPIICISFVSVTRTQKISVNYYFIFR